MNLLILACLFLWISCVIFLWLWIQNRQSFWRRKAVMHLKPLPFLGCLKDLLTLKCSFGDLFEEIHQKAKEFDQPLIGFYMLHTPALLIREPQLIREIFVKNANLFPNRYESADPVGDPFGFLTLPLAKYHLWKDSRRKLSHLFTSALVQKKMFPKIAQVCQSLQDFIDDKLKTSGSTEAILEVKEMCGFYTIDVTTNLMYSLDEKTLEMNGSIFSRQVEDLFQPTPWKVFGVLMTFFLPHLTTLFKIKVFSQSFLNGMKLHLEKAMKDRGHQAHEDPEDLIDFLLEFQKESKESWLKSEEFLISQVGIFLLAGFETSSSLLALVLYELAKHQPLQEKLRQELRANLPNKDLKVYDFFKVKSLPFLDLVVLEALRLYPTSSFINREYLPQNKTDSFSLKPYHDFCLPPGMPVYVSLLGLQRDEKYWKDPLTFNPYRFNSNNSEARNTLAFIPFGCGPHSCIGSRLGILQIKMALIQIIQSYRIDICDNTISKIVFDPKTFMLNARDDINLKFFKL